MPPTQPDCTQYALYPSYPNYNRIVGVVIELCLGEKKIFFNFKKYMELDEKQFRRQRKRESK